MGAEAVSALLAISSLTVVTINHPLDPGAGVLVAQLLSSPAGTRLRRLGLDGFDAVTRWSDSDKAAITEALAVNEGVVDFSMRGVKGRVQVSPINVTIMNSNGITNSRQTVQERRRRWRERLRSLAAIADEVATADTTATPIEAWFPDLCLRVEREAVRLQKLVLWSS